MSLFFPFRELIFFAPLLFIYRMLALEIFIVYYTHSIKILGFR